MFRKCLDPGVRPPPPNYCDAVKYPTSSNRSCNNIRNHDNYKRSNSYPGNNHSDYKLQDNHGLQRVKSTPSSNDVLCTCSYSDQIYQTLSSENKCYQSVHRRYNNIPPVKAKKRFKYVYAYKKTENGRPLYALEAIPETLASETDHMGVKTYAQLEVIAAEDYRTNHREGIEIDPRKLEARGSVMCGVGGESSCEVMSERLSMNGGGGGVSRCPSDTVQPVHSNGKATIVPINGMVGPNSERERLIVETILGDVDRNSTDTYAAVNGTIDDFHDDLDDLPPPPSDMILFCENETEDQCDRDLENYTQALEYESALALEAPPLELTNGLDRKRRLENGYDNESDNRSGESRENSPLLPAFNAQSNSPKLERLQLPDGHGKQKGDHEVECGDSGYSDCNRLELREHVTDFSTEHTTENVIYSEPEYSSSDVSLKCTGDSPKMSRAAGTCQRTLKRTNNGQDHTVYELSPSDSFYNSTDNVYNRNASIASSEGICRIGQSSSSLAESSSKARQPLNRETSVSFKKPLVTSPKSSNNKQSPTVEIQEQQQPEPEMDTEDGEPLVNPQQNNSMIEDSRTYYRRKAADRGTMYCACGGITIVATIVFLLIYFS